MNKKRFIAILFIFSLIVFSKCKIPFEPEFLGDISEILVIDGDIVVGGMSKIYISTAIPVNSDMFGMLYNITKADVSIEDDIGNTYRSDIIYGHDVMYEFQSYYEVDTRHFLESDKYRLVVRYENNEYATDFLPVIKTPEIKDINFSVSPDKDCIYFQVSTEGVDDQSKYYKWRYEEDWEFSAPFQYNDGSDAGSCWGKDGSTDIIIATSKDLDHNIIREHRVNKILKNEKKISKLYRIRLYQTAISGPEYRYLYNVRKNSNEIGGIFGPQPSEMSGNVKCINDSSIDVLGFISCSTVTTMTKYFEASEIGIYEETMPCKPIVGNFPNYSNTDMEAAGYRIFDQGPDGTVWISVECVDCSYYGSRNRPIDWLTTNE